MAAYSFPSSPVDGQRYPVNPGTSGKVQFQWDATLGVWSTVQSTVKTNNQQAFNNYVWPTTAPSTTGYQLTGDAEGVLSWSPAATPVVKSLSLLEAFDGILAEFTLVETGTTTPFAPAPSNNLIVFLGGVPQINNAAYSVTASSIVFTEAPLTGTSFNSFTLVNTQ